MEPTAQRRVLVGAAVGCVLLSAAWAGLASGADARHLLTDVAITTAAVVCIAMVALGQLRLRDKLQAEARELRADLQRQANALSEAHERLRAEAEERARESERTRALEIAVQRSQKQESLGLLAGGIAHDFNNLLVGILNNAELIRHELDPDAESSERLEQVEIAASRAADLCRQMLTYAGDTRPSQKILSLTEVVEEMAELLSVSMPQNASLTVTNAGAGMTVEGDPTQLRQVIMNLIVNAGEALPQGRGEVTITLGRWAGASSGEDVIAREGELSPSGPSVFIRVTDTGTGIDPVDAARMFDPFFSSKFAGRGLGLASVLGIVKAHNGGIEVKSKVGGGTTITVVLPAVDGVPVPVCPTSSAHWARFGGGVLLVEDEPLVRETFKALLTSAGFEVFTARDGYEGLKTFRKHKSDIDCVVLDLVMPRMDGADFLTQLRRGGADTPVVAVSGFTDAQIRGRIATHDVACTLTKPIPGAQLVEAVRRAIRRAIRAQSRGTLPGAVA